MEDSSRDVEKELKQYTAVSPLKRSGTWQMLLVSEDGKMISVKRYKGLAQSIVALLVLSLLATAFFSVLYYRSLKTIRQMSVAIEHAEAEKKVLQDKKEHLEAKVFLSEKGKKVTATPKKSAAVKKTAPPAKKVVKKIEKMKAAVNDLTVTKDAATGETRIRFIVKNDCDLKSIAGRVFVILKPKSGNSGDWLTMPPVLLKKGEPSLPSRGQFFSINNFKSVNFKFNNPLPDDHYKSMDVYIYSTDGNKIFADTFPIQLIVINKPKPKPEVPVTKKDKPDSTAGTSTVSDPQAKPASTSGSSTDMDVVASVASSPHETSVAASTSETVEAGSTNPVQGEPVHEP